MQTEIKKRKHCFFFSLIPDGTEPENNILDKAREKQGIVKMDAAP
jgi:hypothetical protein